MFTQQSISVAYSQHWTCYLLFIFSLGAMVEALRIRQGRSRLKGRGWSWIFSLFALASSLLHLLTMEYFAGLELLRPVLLWFLVSPAGQTLRKKMLVVLCGWLPYLATLGGFTIWRLFFLRFPGVDSNSPGLLLRIAAEPASGLLRLAQIAVQDTLHLFVSVWANILAPANLDLRDRFALRIVLLSLPYWFYSLGREYAHIMDSFQQGMPLETHFRHYAFQGNSKDVLVVLYQPADHDCLEVLTPEDGNAPGMPGVTAAAVPNANFSRILAEPISGSPPLDIFGPEPDHGWCYLYEKADLARQFEDWQEVARLSDQARLAGYHPEAAASDTAFEWLPFIEGYARADRLQDAKEFSLAAFREDKKIAPRMCNLWEKIQIYVPESAQTANDVSKEIMCSR